ncbi:carbohydrate ABC transporter substrate-binding protein [Erysipelothrix urinaevulpis]|uniref:carbohydrate ABC transporter substrate-binding protein n=1 Tax=Erysipelothrix urinaevulpis TaxID=2683717 RepID=UPI001359FEF0|nr:carbohydrate ABC transporter substrate-binding protein [Erysipelothrix urinaevulpis]
MRKIFVSMIVVLLLVAGCSKKPAEPENKKLTVYGLESGYGKGAWEEVVKAFEDRYEMEVELVMEKNIAEILLPKLQSGEAPDVVYLALDNGDAPLTNTLVTEKEILDITDVLDMDVSDEGVKVKDKILPGMLDSNRVKPYGDDKAYLAPMFYAPLGMFYNANLFEEKGWEVPTTWDEMFALGDKAKAEGISLFTYPITGYFDGFFGSLLNVTAGPEMYAKLMAYDADAWNDPKTKEAFELIGKLAEYVHPNTVAQANKEGFTKNQQLILENEALFIPNGTWLPEEMKDAPRVDGFEWGFAPIPAVGEGDRYASTFTEQVYIPKGAENVDGAKQFISFLYSDEAAKIFFNNGEAVQPIVGSDKLMGEDNVLSTYYSIFTGNVKTNTTGFNAAEPVEGVNLKDVLYGNINSIVNGDLTVDEWHQEVVEVMGRFNQ